MSFPLSLARRLRMLLVEDLQPACVSCGGDYLIRSWWGSPEPFGFVALSVGADVRDVFPILHGLDTGERIDLPFVETPGGGAVRVRVLPESTGSIVFVTDATREWQDQRGLQQAANENRLLNRRLEELAAELEVKREEAESANRAKGRFIAGLSHELRTPLASILGHTGWLKDARTPPTAAMVEEALDAVTSGATHLLSLIDSILDHAQIESGRLVFDYRPGPLERLWQEMTQLFEPLARQRGLAFDLVLGAGMPAWVTVDITRVRQVTINLLNNAFKFTRDGGVTLSVDWVDGVLYVTVQDTGPGVPAEARERIFQAFHQEPGSGGGGVGLGLAISSELVRQMSGTLALQSSPGGGARFRFSVPAPAAEPVSAPHVPVPVSGTHLPGARSVLVVDDNEDLRAIYGRYLARADFEVLIAEDTDAALVTASEERPAAVLMDLYLGEEDGAAAVARMREKAYGGVVIALSASPSTEDRERALAAGCDDYLTKPIDGKALVEAVSSHLARRVADGPTDSFAKTQSSRRRP